MYWELPAAMTILPCCSRRCEFCTTARPPTPSPAASTVAALTLTTLLESMGSPNFAAATENGWAMPGGLADTGDPKAGPS
jgi:hypothetical protein